MDGLIPSVLPETKKRYADPANLGQLTYERVENDFYATLDLRPVPVLLAALLEAGYPMPKAIHECCAGQGHLSNILAGYGHKLFSSDLIQREGFILDKILDAGDLEAIEGDALVTNPPYKAKLLERLLRHWMMLARSEGKLVALLLRFDFDAPQSRWRRELFMDPQYFGKIVLPNRPIFYPPFPKKLRIAPRQPFAWYVWDFSRPVKLPGKTYYPLGVQTPACIKLMEHEGADTAHTCFETDVCPGAYLTGEVLALEKARRSFAQRLNSECRRQYDMLVSGHKLMQQSEGLTFVSTAEPLQEYLKKALTDENGLLGHLVSAGDGLPGIGECQSWYLRTAPTMENGGMAGLCLGERRLDKHVESIKNARVEV